MELKFIQPPILIVIDSENNHPNDNETIDFLETVHVSNKGEWLESVITIKFTL